MTKLSVPKKIGVIAVLAVSFLLGLYSMRGDSAIVDEIAHIPAGYNYVVDGDYRLNPEHPPLMKFLAGVPLAFLDLTFPYDLRDWREVPNGQWESGWKFLYERGNDPDQILFWARLPILLSFLFFLYFVFRWARELWGDKVGFVALIFAAFSPNLLAHARYVTTDMGVVVTFFLAMYTFWRFLKKPSWKWILWMAVAFAFAQLAKFSNVLLPVYMVLLAGVLVFAWKGRRVEFRGLPFSKLLKPDWLQRVWAFVFSLGVVFVLGYLLVWLAYVPVTLNSPPDLLHATVDAALGGPDLAGTRAFLHGLFNNAVTFPIAHYVLGLFMVFNRVAGGNTTYFLGQVTNQSFWYFYPVSFLIKTPIPMLIGFVGGLVLLFRGVRRVLRQKMLPEHAAESGPYERRWDAMMAAVSQYLPEFMFLTLMAMFMVVGVVGNLNIGLRHILPLYPFLLLLVAKYSVAVWDGAKRLRKVILGLLFAWYVVGAFVAFPSFLSYFNELVGQDNAYRYTTDSNLDWGQDLKRLAQFVEEKNIDKIKVDYFGGGVPEYYLGDHFIAWHANNGQTTGWIAVSATFFQNSKWYAMCCGEMDYRWLEAYEPVGTIGGSILIYNIPETE